MLFLSAVAMNFFMYLSLLRIVFNNRLPVNFRKTITDPPNYEHFFNYIIQLYDTYILTVSFFYYNLQLIFYFTKFYIKPLNLTHMLVKSIQKYSNSIMPFTRSAQLKINHNTEVWVLFPNTVCHYLNKTFNAILKSWHIEEACGRGFWRFSMII